MIYPFECSCGRKTDVVRQVDERDYPVTCCCGRAMRRVPAVPQLVRDPWAYRDNNREIRDRTDLLADMKADEKRYLRSWEPSPTYLEQEAAA